MNDPAKSPNIIVYQSPAQNASCSASGSTQKSVVSVVTIIGCNRDFPAATSAST